MEVTTQTVFIANDGKEFPTKEDCLEYEKRLAEYAEKEKAVETARNMLEKLRIPSEQVPYIPLWTFVGEEGNRTQVKSTLRRKKVQYFQLHNKKEALALATVIADKNSRYCESPEELLKKSGKLSYPCIAIYEPYATRKIETIDADIRMIRKFLEIHGYKITVEKIESEN